MTTPRRGGASDGRDGRGRRGRPAAGGRGRGTAAGHGRPSSPGRDRQPRSGRGGGAAAERGEPRPTRGESGRRQQGDGRPDRQGRRPGSEQRHRPDRPDRRPADEAAQGQSRGSGAGGSRSSAGGRGGQERHPAASRGSDDRGARGDSRRAAGASGNWRDRHPADDRRRSARPGRGGEPAGGQTPPAAAGPEIPEWADPRDLDPGVRSSLRGLESRNADRVARHLVAAGSLIDEDPDQALVHARAARDRASRIAAVREAVGVAAYHAGDYAEAARELRAYRRMTGDEAYRAVLADCERALGRPEVALRMVTDALADRPDAGDRVELHLVEAGARQDLGEGAAARLVLEDALGGRPVPTALCTDADLGTLRLASAYADLLRNEGEGELADEWLAAIAAADPENEVGALERLGVEFEEEDDDEVARVVAGPDVESLDPGSEAGSEAGMETDIEADAAAEVAELLGQTSSDPASDPGSGGH